MKPEKLKQTPVAIVGMACIFAKSPDLNAYLHLLMKGIDGISDPPASHEHLRRYFDPDPKKADHIYCNRGGFIPHSDFDPTEFGIPPSALEATDTSQLLGLLTAKKALADAGYGDNGKSFDRTRTSVVLGVTGTQELAIPLGSRLGHPLWRKAMRDAGIPSETAETIVNKISNSYVEWQENSFPGLLGNVVAGRIANRLDLGGTNCVVDAACASSMGAIHVALLELEAGRSDMAITGGVDTINDVFMHMCFSKTHILSASGDVRPFSKDADGTVLGEGVGLLVLKRLEDAQRDEDRIYAVIKGIGSASDGKSQSIYAPRPDGQASALKRAYEEANIDPSKIALLEAHGTGTRVGDGVEFEALRQIFEKENTPPHQCALGSVKSNIGHTKAAAGTAGMIKAALSLYHKMLPPTLKAEEVDPKIDIEHSPFYINQTLRPWLSSNDEKRVAGVSAFGFGGSNFHVVLEEASKEKELPSWSGTVEIVALSADSHSGLAEALDQWHQSARSCHYSYEFRTLFASSRQNFNANDTKRLLMAMSGGPNQAQIDEYHLTAKDLLLHQASRPGDIANHIFIGDGPQAGPLAFLFPGQGSQYVGMGRDIICAFPESLKVFENAASQMGNTSHLDEAIFPKMAGNRAHYEQGLRKTNIAQPAIGAVSVAMLAALEFFGITPEATCGHSYGELVALHAAGWLSQEDLWTLSAARGDLMANATQSAMTSGTMGTMMAVAAPIRELERFVDQIDGLVLANYNGPEQGVLSGTTAAMAHARQLCKEQGWQCVDLAVAGAFHSPLMADAKAPFDNLLKKTNFQPNRIAVMSNALADAYPKDPIQIRTALGDQLVHSVKFLSNIEKLYDQGIRAFIEVGPKSVLTGLVHTILAGRRYSAFSLDRSHGQNDGLMDLADLLCALGSFGYPVSLNRWENAQPQPGQKPRMQIALNGANYRTAKKVSGLPLVATSQAPSSTIEAAPQPKALSNQQDSTPIPSIKNGLSMSAPQPLVTEPKKTMSHQHPDMLKQSLIAVQQGITSMQKLQSQTTQAHQKYLEVQAEAGKTLAAMIQNAQGLAYGGSGTSHTSTAPSQEINSTSPKPQTTQSDTGQNSRQFQPQPSDPTIAQGSAPGQLAHQTDHTSNTAAPPSLPASDDIQNDVVQVAVIGIVSELTGYPMEMLGMEMDIESDLGIDSIKRVEILSAVEEKMPDLPKVTPDMLGDLKTLGQICAYLTSSSPQPRQAAPSTPMPAVGSSSQGNEAQSVQLAVIGIVSELTGYPMEMLGMEMDIESDLGIDSIKRVEILSAVEEKMPDLPKVTPDMLGDLKTLGQICAYLTSSSPQPRQAAPSTPMPAVGSSSQGNEAQSVQLAVIGIVSELTGYPMEMLGMEMDIESDLGIDSIKRVEILSAVEEKMPDLPKVTPDMLGDLKTLGQICAYLSPDNDNHAIEPSPAPSIAQSKPESSPNDEPVPALMRYTIKPVAIDAMEGNTPTTIETPFKALIVSENLEMAQAIGQEIQHKGGTFRFAKPDETPPSDEGLTGLVLVSPLTPLQAFSWAQTYGRQLRHTAKKGYAFLCSVSFLDGAFGFINGSIHDPTQGALSGLIKTAALEWPGVHCRAFDIDPEWLDYNEVARSMISQLNASYSDPVVEIGLTQSHRYRLCLEPTDLSSSETLTLSEQDVVVVTGGARGITASAAKALALKTRCRLALLGRSDAPQEEPTWLQGLTTPAELKKAILSHGLNDGNQTPMALEKAYQYWMANRQIIHTMQDFADNNISAHYFATDVRRPKSLAQVFAKIREELGPVRGLIHGAGILEDRLIEEKTTAQFESVYDTKVTGLYALLEASREDDLRYVVLFSSVSGRLGNIGQADYAMANEVLNKMAREQTQKRPECKVISINWGPWDGGMVTPGLKRHFAQKGVGLISPTQGAQAMLQEMARPLDHSIEMVIQGVSPLPLETAMDGTANIHKQRPSAAGPLNLAARRQINLSQYPVLESHYLNGRPVVPLALITEWLAHGALHANPGLVLHGIDHLRLFKGIALEKPQKDISLMTGALERKSDFYEVSVEIHDGGDHAKPFIHTSATAILTDHMPSPPLFSENGHFKALPPLRTLDDYYRDVLFHGDALQGLKEIIRISDEGMTASIEAAPEPNKWINDPWRSQWIVDPLVLDCAFQMAIIWCHEQLGLVSLPNYVTAYRQYCNRFPDQGVTAVLEVEETSHYKMIGRFTFLDHNNKVVATIQGFEAIMDRSLFKAFGVKAA